VSQRTSTGSIKHPFSIDPQTRLDEESLGQVSGSRHSSVDEGATRAASEEDAVVLAIDTPSGLGFYLFAAEPEQALRVADRIESGMVYVNFVDAGVAELPFGEVKPGGFGRKVGRYGAGELVTKKLILIGQPARDLGERAIQMYSLFLRLISQSERT
jgi:hypothetical protein